mgnify:FL=1
MKKIGKIINKQDPFNVGQKIKVISSVIVIDENIEDVSQYCLNLYKSGEWQEIIGNFGIGNVWTGTKFIPQQQYASWTFDDTNNIWVAPIEKPISPTFTMTQTINEVEESWEVDIYKIYWNESNLRWQGYNAQDNNTYYWNPDSSTWNLI